MAIADYHYPNSQEWSQTALVTYLFGLSSETSRDEHGRLKIKWNQVQEHVWGTKRVRSGFFNLEHSEHISAVISTREADIWKFNRMGLKAGFGAPGIKMMRVGTRYINDPNAAAPEPVALEVHPADYTKEWTDGLQIYHNPNAEHPLEPNAFPGAVHHRLERGMLVSYSNGSNLFGTRTFFTT